jgi:hypothetical protein
LDRYVVQVDLDLSGSTSWVNWGGSHFDTNTLIGGLEAPANYTVRVGAIVNGVLQGYGETTTSTLALPTGPVGPAPIIVFNPVLPGAAGSAPSASTTQVSETVTVTLTIPVGDTGTAGGATGNNGKGIKAGISYVMAYSGIDGTSSPSANGFWTQSPVIVNNIIHIPNPVFPDTTRRNIPYNKNSETYGYGYGLNPSVSQTSGAIKMKIYYY